jgi:fructose-bisphosphate aldolase, class II
VFVLRDILRQAQNDGRAVGHFNIADFVMLKAVFASAQDLKVPVIVGASEGERKFLGVRRSRPWCEDCEKNAISRSF